jgi:hypothetical protein
MLERMVRSTASERMPPSAPGEAEKRAADLPRKASSSFSSPSARDAQSMAFLSPPGTELLYSGVEMRKPSASTMSFFRRLAPAGRPEASSSSPS